MAQINFDPNKPGYRSKLTSGELSGNFQALSRANDLRVTEQDPPDLTVRVEAGAYATTSEKTLRYEGGDSDPLDATTGGSVGQKRVFVLELEPIEDPYGVTHVLHWNNDSSWVTPPVVPTVPAYSANRIPLCEVTVTYGDTEIVEDQIADARPMINLGIGVGQALSPGSVILTATAGQTVFDTSASFTFTPDEILVWSTNPGVSPDPANGLFFRVYGVDYTELTDTTIQFGPSYSFGGGELVVIWKVGLAATPGSFGLSDLSNVDGNQEDAFLEADNPISGNPFLTESGHNAIDHLTDVASLADVATHILTTATNKHMGDEIQITDPGAFSNATDVQDALEDVDDNIYTPFLEEHNPSGTHGPNVTIDTTAGTDPSLTITQDINAEGLRVDKSHTGGSPAVIISNTGTGSGLQIEQIGEASGEVIVKTATGAEPALLIQNSGATGAGLKITQAGGGSGATIIKTSTGAESALFVDNSGTGIGVRIRQSTSPVTTAALYVEQKHSTGRAVRVDQGGDSVALYLNKTAGGAGNVIEIYNGGIGYDIEGHNGNWSIDKNGNAIFNSLALIVAQQSIHTFDWSASSAAQSTGALGFTPRVAFALMKATVGLSVGFATGTGVNAKLIACRETYNAGTTDWGTAYGDSCISGLSTTGTSQANTLSWEIDVSAWSASGITLTPTASITARVYLLVMG